MKRLGLVAAVTLLLAGLQHWPGTAATTSAPAATVTVPERSRIYDRVDATAGCGSAPAHTWTAPSGGVNGTGYYAGGEYVWTDYTNDDAGTGELIYPGEGELVQPEAGTAGTISELLNTYGASAADLVEARFALDDTFLHARLVTNFLNATDTTVVTLGFDLDGDDGTGAGTWPFNAGVTSPGTDAFLTAHPSAAGFCATWTDASGDHDLPALGGAARVDTSENTIDLSLPRSLLGASPAVDVVAGSGLWDTDTGAWKRPVRAAKSPLVPEELRAGEADDVRGGLGDNDPGVFNLLFRGDEDMVDLGNATDAASTGSKRAFEFLKQAAVLQTGTSGDYRLELDLTRIVPGAAAEPQPTRRGDRVEFSRQYVSAVDLEGLVWFENDISRDIIYLGRRQSYAVHLPPCLAGVDGAGACPSGGVPLAVSFHGGSGSHINQFEDLATGVAAPMAERAQVLTMAPFGRGRRAPWWRGLGEVDVLEATADVERAYPVDTNRRLAYGGSLGGYATLRFSSLYPDLWTGAAAYCPATYENSTSTREPGNEVTETQSFTVFPLLDSLVNTPLVQVSGTIDPLVRIDNGHRLRDRALAAGLDLRYTEWVNGHHCTWVPETQQRFPDWHIPEMLTMLERPRPSNPAVVNYASDPRHLTPGVEYLGIAHLDDVGVRHDRAWWVSDVRLRDSAIAAAGAPPAVDIAGNTIGGAGDDVVGTVRAVSHALDGWNLGTTSCGNEYGLAGISGNPEVQQTPGSATGTSIPEPHHFVCQRQLATTPARQPLLELATRNLRSLTINRAAAGLKTPMTMSVTGDGPVEVLLVGGAGRTALGPCVTGQRIVPRGLSVTLDAAATPCGVAIR